MMSMSLSASALPPSERAEEQDTHGWRIYPTGKLANLADDALTSIREITEQSRDNVSGRQTEQESGRDLAAFDETLPFKFGKHP
jgi:hypothetical protein